MVKRAETQTTARGGRKTATRQGTPNGHKRHANGKVSSRQAAKGKGGSRQSASRRAALAGRRANGASAGHAANGKSASHASADGTIALTLTSTQVRQILHAAGGGETELSSLLDGSVMTDSVLALETWEGRYRQELEAGSASSSLLRGLLILACFPRDGTRRTVHWVAEHTGMEMSTTHRYIRTLLLLGFLEQDPKTRAYSRVTA
jgi:IclR helix-turn-helix domain